MRDRDGGRRGGRGRSGGGSGRGRGDRRNNSGHDNRRRRRDQNQDPRAAAASGNKRERIAVESGFLVLIDQFMLANPQFTDKLLKLKDEGVEAKDGVIRQYGGTVVELEPGTYRIERDPYAYTIIIHRSNSAPDSSRLIQRATDTQGHVLVDTRCLAMIDRELLDDSILLEKYQQLWFGGQEKACRDLIRDNGGAVRYGFRRYGDELGVYSVPDEAIVCLWPDVNEPAGEGDDAAVTVDEG